MRLPDDLGASKPFAQQKQILPSPHILRLNKSLSAVTLADAPAGNLDALRTVPVQPAPRSALTHAPEPRRLGKRRWSLDALPSPSGSCVAERHKLACDLRLYLQHVLKGLQRVLKVFEATSTSATRDAVQQPEQEPLEWLQSSLNIIVNECCHDIVMRLGAQADEPHSDAEQLCLAVVQATRSWHRSTMAQYQRWADAEVKLPVRPLDDQLRLLKGDPESQTEVMLMAEVLLYKVLQAAVSPAQPTLPRAHPHLLHFLFWVLRFAPEFNVALFTCKPLHIFLHYSDEAKAAERTPTKRGAPSSTAPSGSVLTQALVSYCAKLLAPLESAAVPTSRFHVHHPRRRIHALLEALGCSARHTYNTAFWTFCQFAAAGKDVPLDDAPASMDIDVQPDPSARPSKKTALLNTAPPSVDTTPLNTPFNTPPGSPKRAPAAHQFTISCRKPLGPQPDCQDAPPSPLRSTHSEPSNIHPSGLPRPPPVALPHSNSLTPAPSPPSFTDVVVAILSRDESPGPRTHSYSYPSPTRPPHVARSSGSFSYSPSRLPSASFAHSPGRPPRPPSFTSLPSTGANVPAKRSPRRSRPSSRASSPSTPSRPPTAPPSQDPCVTSSEHSATSSRASPPILPLKRTVPPQAQHPAAAADAAASPQPPRRMPPHPSQWDRPPSTAHVDKKPRLSFWSRFCACSSRAESP